MTTLDATEAGSRPCLPVDEAAQTHRQSGEGSPPVGALPMKARMKARVPHPARQSPCLPVEEAAQTHRQSGEGSPPVGALPMKARMKAHVPHPARQSPPNGRSTAERWPESE